MTQVPVQACSQELRWVSLPYHSPGVREARDAESPAPQTPKKKEPADWGKVSEMEGPQKSGHEPEAPLQLPCPEATNLLLTGPPGQLFLLQDGSSGGNTQIRCLVPASHV